MRDKVLSALDTDISGILNDDVSDEIKAKNYLTVLTRFRNLSAPPKKAVPPPPPPAADPAAAPPAAAAPQPQPQPQDAVASYKAVGTPKRPHKRRKVEIDPTLWKRTLRTPSKKKFSPQWLTFNETPKKKKNKKPLKSWIQP